MLVDRLRDPPCRGIVPVMSVQPSPSPGVPNRGDQLAPAPAASQRRRLRLALLVLIVLGFALRAYPILWGSQLYDSDQYSFHADEPKLVRYVDDFPESLKTNHDYRYPTFLHNVYGVLWAAAGGALDLREPGASAVGKPSYERALLFGRGLNILLFGMGGMWLTWLFARRLFGPTAALYTLAVQNMLGLPVTSAALVQTDVPSAIGLLLVFLLLLRVDGRPQVLARHGLTVGLALGAAISMKYTAAVGALAVAIVAVSAVRRGASTWGQASRFVGLAGVGAVLAVLLFIPGILYDFDNFAKSINYEFNDKSVKQTFALGRFTDGIQKSQPIWVLIPAAGAFLFCLWRRRSAILLSITVCLAIYLVVVAKAFKPDYSILVSPFVAVYAGFGLWSLGQLRPQDATRNARLALLSVFLIGGHLFAGWTVYQRYASDTRYRFGAWVEANVEPGEIGDAPRPLGPTWADPKAPAGYTFVSVHKRPEWIVSPERSYMHPLRAMVEPEFYVSKVPNPANFTMQPGARKMYAIGERDFLFYEDVHLQLRRDFRYDKVEEFVPPNLPLDMQGLTVQIFRRSAEAPSEPR